MDAGTVVGVGAILVLGGLSVLVLYCALVTASRYDREHGE